MGIRNAALAGLAMATFAYGATEVGMSPERAPGSTIATEAAAVDVLDVATGQVNTYDEGKSAIPPVAEDLPLVIDIAEFAENRVPDSRQFIISGAVGGITLLFCLVAPGQGSKRREPDEMDGLRNGAIG